MAVETDEATLIFDYYTDPAGVLDSILARARRLYVMVSHSHRDHLNMDIFSWAGVTRYVLANECRRKLKRAIDVDALPISWLHHDESWTDEVLALTAFDSTDVGVSFLATIQGRRMFHAGDLNCWHFSEESDAQQVRKAVGDFRAILGTIAATVQHVDVAMFPVTPNIGGDFALGARLWLQAIDTDLFLPMHTWARDREAAQYDLYRNPQHGKCLLLHPGESIDP